MLPEAHHKPLRPLRYRTYRKIQPVALYCKHMVHHQWQMDLLKFCLHCEVEYRINPAPAVHWCNTSQTVMWCQESQNFLPDPEIPGQRAGYVFHAWSCPDQSMESRLSRTRYPPGGWTYRTESGFPDGTYQPHIPPENTLQTEYLPLFCPSWPNWLHGQCSGQVSLYSVKYHHLMLVFSFFLRFSFICLWFSHNYKCINCIIYNIFNFKTTLFFSIFL